MYTCFTCICLIHIMGYREVFMSGIFLDNKGCDFFFINFQFYKNSKLVGGWWVGFFFLPQTLWAFLILILVYYCPYFSLYVGRDPLSCQSDPKDLLSFDLPEKCYGQFPLFPIFLTLPSH